MAHRSSFDSTLIYFRSDWLLTGDQVCAKGDVADVRNGRVPDTCSGDSGGGLVARRFDGNFVLLGVVREGLN